MAYGEKEYKDKCVLYVCVYSTAQDTKYLTYMRVHVCGSCAEMLEESAENFCFNDSGITSIRILTFGRS